MWHEVFLLKMSRLNKQYVCTPTRKNTLARECLNPQCKLQIRQRNFCHRYRFGTMSNAIIQDVYSVEGVALSAKTIWRVPWQQEICGFAQIQIGLFGENIFQVSVRIQSVFLSYFYDTGNGCTHFCSQRRIGKHLVLPTITNSLMLRSAWVLSIFSRSSSTYRRRYPERVLADKIYRNRNNLNYCKQHRIRLSEDWKRTLRLIKNRMTSTNVSAS